MKRILYLYVLLASLALSSFAQSASKTADSLKGGPTLPTKCNPATSGSKADVFIKTGSSAGVYYCSAANTWTALAGGGGGGTGDFVGPASSTDNAVVRFDGTTGKLGQNSAVTIADTTGDITGGKYNKVTITAPASGATLTIADGKVFTVSNTLTFTGTDSSSVALGAGGTVLYSGGALGTPSSGTATNLTGTASGLTAGAATVLATARAINGVSFDGSAAITVTAAAGTLTGATLASGVTASSLTSFGGSPTIITPSFTTGFTIGGVAATGTIPRGNGTNFIASAFTMAAPGTSGNVLTSDGTDWTSAAAVSNLTLATSTITGGANTKVLFNNSGVLGEYTISGSGNVAMTTSPAFTTPTLGVATATSINKVTITAPATSATLTITDGKTASFSNSITFAGTDSTVMTFPGATDTIAGLGAAQTFTGANAFTSAVTTGNGASSGTVFNYNSLSSGDGLSASSSSATSGRLVNLAITGTAALTNNTVLNISNSGATSTNAQTTYGAIISNTRTNATSGTNIGLAIAASGATTENRAIYVSAGQVSIQSGTSAVPAIGLVPGLPNYGIYYAGGVNFTLGGSPVLNVNTTTVLASGSMLGWTSAASAANATADLILRRSAAANLAFGAADVAGSPVAQTLSVQGATGVSNTAGANFTIKNSASSGNAAGGSFIVQVTPAGSSGTSQNAYATALTIDSTKLATFAIAPSSVGAGALSERYGAGASTASNTVSLAVGNSAAVSNTGGTAIGYSAAAASGTAIGRDAVAADNEFVSGSSNLPINNLYFGKGKTSTTATAFTINGTGGSGSDNAAAAVNIAGGAGTGTGAGGSVVLQVAPAGSTGSSANALVAGLTVNSAVHVIHGGSAPTVGGSCGTSPSIAGTDSAGKLTTGTVAPTSCTITFNKAWTTAPSCFSQNETTANLVKAVSTTTTLTVSGTFAASDVLSYACIGY